MTRIKLCGMTRLEDIAVVNDLKPDFIGFVFWEKSSRNVSPALAKELKAALSPEVKAVGVFVDEELETVADFLQQDIIDMAQLHGQEDNAYIEKLRSLTGKEIIKAFKVKGPETLREAESSPADYILLDSGKGSGLTFDWSAVEGIKRPYILAGGLHPDNVEKAICALAPYGVDVSSGIETDGKKDKGKMIDFVRKVREESL